MGTVLYGTDAVCMALLAVSVEKWEGTSRAKGVDTAVMIIQVITLAVKWGIVENGLAIRKEGWGSRPSFESVTARCQGENALAAVTGLCL